MRRYLLLVIGLAMGLVSPSYAQTGGSCEWGAAVGTLETAYLQTRVFNTGGLFFGGGYTSGDGYLVPRVDGTSPVFAAGLWLGGRVDPEGLRFGDVRVAAARYGGYDFWPGPLEDADNPPGDCFAYDRIYEVSRQDIARYLNTGEATDDLRDWPYTLSAPVLDGDGDTTNYDLRAGDQPALLGDVNVFWVMNDAGNDHNPGLPLGVEVRVLGFAFEDVRNRELSQTTFYRYEIVNRGRQPIVPMYASMFADADLGDASDDYTGSDSLRSMTLIYNTSNEDNAYGEAPPAWGIQVLDGPMGLANGRDDDRDGRVDEPGERLRATAASSFYSGGPDGTQDPGTPEGYYNYMKGLWGDGSPYMERGNGFEQPGAPTTPFMFPGDPVTRSHWSQFNTDGTGGTGPRGDTRMVISTGPFELAPDASVTLVYAMPFARGSDHLQSVARLQDLAEDLSQRYADGAFAPQRVTAGEWEFYRQPEPGITLSRVHPNPSSRQPEVVLMLPEAAHVRAVVYDVRGRAVATLADHMLRAGETRLAVPVELAAGAYSLRVEVDRSGFDVLSFTVVR